MTVEALALQHYETLGYKGFDSPFLPSARLNNHCFRYHSEGSIVRTIFGLLFFDIIFTSIPGAFETPYQSAPLDIAEDSFYFARRDLIERRLDEIEAGAAAEIIERTDETHRERKTWCVGVHWDLFNRQDLLEIVTVSASWSYRHDVNRRTHQVYERQMLIFHLSIVLRGLRCSRSWSARSLSLELERRYLQIRRGERARGYTTRKPEGNVHS